MEEEAKEKGRQGGAWFCAMQQHADGSFCFCHVILDGKVALGASLDLFLVPATGKWRKRGAAVRFAT